MNIPIPPLETLRMFFQSNYPQKDADQMVNEAREEVDELMDAAWVVSSFLFKVKKQQRNQLMLDITPNDSSDATFRSAIEELRLAMRAFDDWAAKGGEA